jgi:hypothetical protein
MDFRVVASEFLRALRGKRSQSAQSRRLGYRSNVARTWEAGRRFPTASELLRVASLRRDLRDAFSEFYVVRPPFLTRIDPSSRAFVPAFLADLKGDRSIVEVAALTGLSRFAVARFLSGAAEPRAPQFFVLIERTSRRLLDFLALFTDVASLSSVREEWKRLEALRRLAYTHPWSEAFLRAVELDPYLALPRHRPGWIADRLGVPRAVEASTLAAMRDAGAITLKDRRYRLDRPRSVHTGQDREAVLRLKRFWSEVAAERIAKSRDGVFSYSVFSVTGEDYRRLVELQQRFYRELMAAVRRTHGSERVVVANFQLFALDDPEE